MPEEGSRRSRGRLVRGLFPLVGFERFVATPLPFYYTPKAQGTGFGPEPRRSVCPSPCR